MTTFHPDLHGLARFIPRFSLGPRSLAAVRWLARAPKLPPGLQATITTREVPGPEGGSPVTVRVHRPAALSAPAPALLWIHGGGFILGKPEQDDLTCAAIAQALGIVVVAVKYRLAPEHPYPAGLEDCYAALTWLHSEAASLGVRADRLAIGGKSAGGGLAAGLALLARDRKVVAPVFQLLIYPMLDDRTAARADLDGTNHRVWSIDSNRFAWRCYLGAAPGGPDVAQCAAPARAPQLAGLPPAWLGVGTYDLFHDEDLAYAARLNASGVPCEVLTVPGAYHGFDIFHRKAAVVSAFRESQLAALRRALFPPSA